jgi:hypothetical protein
MDTKGLTKEAKGWLVLGVVVALFSILIGNLKVNSSMTTTGQTTLGLIDTGMGQFGTFAGISLLVVIFVYLLAKVNNIQSA